MVLDLKITDDLRREGIAREVVRRIQTMRKDMDLDYDRRIHLSLFGDDEIVKGIESFRDYIMQETLADSLTIESGIDGKEWDLEYGTLKVSLKLGEVPV